ncbi:MAG TPA: hypothetical protein VHC69_22605 [Polyangiaceae bacterium]|nr:hypothetical protein [Polyangiaceae bacterium]
MTGFIVMGGPKSILVVLHIGMFCYIAITYIVYRLSPLVAHGAITHSSIFVILVSLCLALPSITIPGFATEGLVIGWELLLSSYSFCVERQAAEDDWFECFFFLLVNPIVVYSERGESIGQPSFNKIGMGRIIFGIVLLFMASAGLKPLAAILTNSSTEHQVVRRLALGLVGVLTLHSMHSGLAHLQIGTMRQVGYILPERYKYPLLAVGAGDFWSRWNTYLGSWIRRYIFIPVAKRRVGLAAIPIAMIFSGLLHDLFVYLQTFSLVARFTPFFVATSAAMIIGRTPERWLRSTRRASSIFHVYGRGLARLLLLAGLVMSAMLWY